MVIAVREGSSEYGEAEKKAINAMYVGRESGRSGGVVSTERVKTDKEFYRAEFEAFWNENNPGIAYTEPVFENWVRNQILAGDIRWGTGADIDLAKKPKFTEAIQIPETEEESLQWVGQPRQTVSDAATWWIGGVGMNKINYDQFWRMYNGVLKNGGTKAQAWNYAMGDLESRVNAGKAVVVLEAAAAVAAGASIFSGAGSSLPAAQAAAAKGGTALGTSGKSLTQYVKGVYDPNTGQKTAGLVGYVKKQALHSAAFATAGQLSYGFISKFTGEWVPYYGKYENWRKS